MTNRSFYAPLRAGVNDFHIGLLPGNYIVQVYQEPRTHPTPRPFSLSGYLVVDGKKTVLRPQWIQPDPTGKATEYSERITLPTPPSNTRALAKVTIHLEVGPDAEDIVLYIFHPMKMRD